MLALTLILLGGFVYAVSAFLDVVEDDMIHGELVRDADHVVALYERDPALLDIDDPSLRVYVARRANTTKLPEALADLDTGHPHEVHLPDTEYEYGAVRRDVGDTSLYVLRDLTPLERLENELIGVAWLVGLASLSLAVIAALWLARIALRPVRVLAERISRVVPGQTRPALRLGTGDRQLDVIVEAFDDVLDRFDAFVAREQAFTEDASHELRTPLATTISSIDLIAQDPTLSAKSRQRLVRARQAAARMQELIEALLLFAREETGHGYQTPVSPAVREAIAAQQQKYAGADSAAPDIVLEIGREHHVDAPNTMLLSIVGNLIRNAVEHGKGARIDVRLDGARLCITDHGTGMTPAVLSRLFDRRFRDEHSHGQGLGLYLVKRISERFDWQVNVRSASGAGTCFELRFPG